MGAPTFGHNYLTINSKGEFYYLPHKQEAPFAAQPMPDEVNGEMMQIMLSDFVPDSASFVFRESGKMTHILQDKDLPKWAPIRLNTSSWSRILFAACACVCVCACLCVRVRWCLSLTAAPKTSCPI